MCDDVKARMIIKQGSGVPTIPATSSHKDGTWLATDIYEGEIYMDTVTGKTYTNNGGAIKSLGAVPVEDTVLKFRVYQVGTAAPTIEEYYNPNGFTLTSIYDAAGIYRVTGLVGELMADTTKKYEISIVSNALLAGSSLDVYPSTNESLTIRSYNNVDVLDDNVINEFSGGSIAAWNVVTVRKYT